MNWPFLVVARLLTGLRPLLFLLPLGYKDYAPHHHQKTVQEVTGAVISRVITQIVEEDSRNADNRGEDEPSLHEGHEIEVGLWVRTHIAANAIRDDGSEFGLFVDRDQFDKACMLHDVSEGVDIGLLMQGRALSLDGEV